LSREDAERFAAKGWRATRVSVWGRVRVSTDKLVATDRQVIYIEPEGAIK